MDEVFVMVRGLYDEAEPVAAFPSLPAAQDQLPVHLKWAHSSAQKAIPNRQEAMFEQWWIVGHKDNGGEWIESHCIYRVPFGRMPEDD